MSVLKRIGGFIMGAIDGFIITEIVQSLMVTSGTEDISMTISAMGALAGGILGCLVPKLTILVFILLFLFLRKSCTHKSKASDIN
ncbi:MAG: hypothetical protein MJ215_05030 [Spirochaetia bacterium]|nr:hypothetical protein [Spirochaetia bacterium]